jgi:hypothetical protein
MPRGEKAADSSRRVERVDDWLAYVGWHCYEYLLLAVMDDLRWRLWWCLLGWILWSFGFRQTFFFSRVFFSLFFSIVCSFQSFSWMWLIPPYSSKGVFLCFLVFRYKADFADIGLAPKI